jgi:hypothetical protein
MIVNRKINAEYFSVKHNDLKIHNRVYNNRLCVCMKVLLVFCIYWLTVVAKILRKTVVCTKNIHFCPLLLRWEMSCCLEWALSNYAGYQKNRIVVE